jgi:benzoate/toluate 1,2-dioxygenase alpha subunit
VDTVIPFDQTPGSHHQYIDEQPQTGLRRIDRSIFTDPELYEKEFSHIWERVWVYVGHESQLPQPRRYITGWIGRVPLIVNRNKEGTLNAFANICSHRGATLCRETKGTKTNFTCPFHGWTFDLDGNLVAPLAEQGAGYPVGFDKKKLGLRRLKLGNYRGFLFASMNDEVEPLEDYLAESKTFIDILVNQSPDGLEVIKGSSTYTYDGNWKLQAENGADGYHVTAVHGNYVETMLHRAASTSAGHKTRGVNVGDIVQARGGFYDLKNGHTIIWGNLSNAYDRPLYAAREEVAHRAGQLTADWAVGRLRNLLIYPNVFLMDQASTQIRMFRPLSVSKTEVTIHCFAPKGETTAARAHRVRQYEDFFNASGMATPDDLTEFRETQKGCTGHSAMNWSDLSRGVTHEVDGPDDYASPLHLSPVRSGLKIEDEEIFVAQHKRWAELMGLLK